jgi:hypothetical protein
MAIQEITVQFREDETHTSQTLTLDGVRFRLDTYTNKADGAWYLDIFDGDGVALVQGIALVTGLDLLFPYRHLDVPVGLLFINDHEGERTDPGLDSFFQREAALYYQTAD